MKCRWEHMTNLHSTMYLLNRSKRNRYHFTSKFTFHYVSIKSSRFFRNLLENHKNLHSTMYLLNRCQMYDSDTTIRNLHSTMYLLNHFNQYQEEYDYINLHSTMYLLNLLHTCPSACCSTNLHSTMYLLNHGEIDKCHCFACGIYIPLCIY